MSLLSEVFLFDFPFDLSNRLPLGKPLEGITALFVALQSGGWAAAGVTVRQRLVAAGAGPLGHDVGNMFEQRLVQW